MLARLAKSPLADIEFLARSEHRVTALRALTRRPRSRADLREMTGASASTIGRTVREFEERQWIRKDGHQFEATQLGAFVASGIQELIDRLETEQTLRSVWQYLPPETSGFTIEMGADAVVTTADASDPYGPVNRFVSVLQSTDRFRFVGYDVALLEPCRDELSKRIVDGMETEIIGPPSVARYIRSTYTDHCVGPFESGNLTVQIHDDLPSFGVSLFDDRVAISGCNPDSGTVQVLLDTDVPETRAWAESIYESCRRASRPITLESAVE